MNSKKIVMPILALGLMTAGGAIWAGRQTLAADSTTTEATSSTAATTTTNDSNAATFADKLSQKLGIGKDKVQTALDEIKKENQDARKAKVGANLDQAVKDGVISSGQKQKILDRQAEMKKQRQQKRDDDQQWAKDNGIDMSKLGPYLGHGKGARGRDKD